MAQRFLLTAGLLLGGLALAPTAAQAGWSNYTSAISEVDACNQAQYQIPAESVLQSFRFGTRTDQDGALFECTVHWSNNSKATPADRPILFPHSVHIPIIWSGWL